MTTIEDLNQITNFKLFSPKILKKTKHLNTLFQFEFHNIYKEILKGAKYKEHIAPDFIAGVRFNKNGRIVFEYNPILMGKLFLFKDQFNSLLRHECLHIILGHLTYRRAKTYNHGRWNIACDLAINSLLTEKKLPEFMIRPEKGEYANFKLGLTAEEYYKQLKDVPPPKSNKLIQKSHVWIKGLKKESKYFIEERKEQIGRMVSAGHMAPCEIDEQKKISNKQNIVIEVPGLSNLERRITRLYETDKKSTRRIPNKRYSEYPSVTKERLPEPIVCLVDYSGSMSDTQLRVLGEFLKRLNKKFGLVVAPFTTVLLTNEAQEYKPNQFVMLFRRAPGGTNISASLKTAYEKYGPKKIVLIVSDFRDDKISIKVHKNTFAITTVDNLFCVFEHNCFHGRTYKVIA